MDYLNRYKSWLDPAFFDFETIDELEGLDDKEIRDRFGSYISFGTAGLRGIVGAGTSRMNRYTVGLATQAFAELIVDLGQEARDRGVVIGHDVRHKSADFARIVAEVFAANGIKVHIFPDIISTPILSYGVRYLKAQAGVMITASHNPKEYNGYKAYWEEGSQILDDIGLAIESKMKEAGDYKSIKSLDFDEALASGKIHYIGEDIMESYLKDALEYSVSQDIDENVKIVYSPLNGTGNLPVRELLRMRGFKKVYLVEEELEPDPDFTTVGYPNPEDPKAFRLARELGLRVGADILIATDPDADRVAVKAWSGQDYVFLNGNEVGYLLAHYIFSGLEREGKLPKDGVMVTSIVTGDLGKVIAKDYGIQVYEGLTGFKNLSQVANEMEKTGEGTFIYGYEESIGFLVGDSVRDKDAIVASMVLAEMAAYYKKKNMTLLDVQEEIFRKYGYYLDENLAISLQGIEGREKIQSIMDGFRENPPKEVAGLRVEGKIDYMVDETGLPKSNVLKFFLEAGSWFALRPSGTEPKIKFYIYAIGQSYEEARLRARAIRSQVAPDL